MTKDEFRAAVLASQAQRKRMEKRNDSNYWEYRRDLKTRIVRGTCVFGTSHLRPRRMKVDCPCCNGTGKVEHECFKTTLECLKRIYACKGPYSSEKFGIYRCITCGQLWKIRFQWTIETGHDDIWLKPGESKRGYEFTEQEAEEVAK